MKKISKKGFTLIELLVVVAIISTLSAVVLQGLNSARVKTRDTQRKAQLTELRKAIDHYFTTTGGYPSTGGGWWGLSPTYGSHTTSGATGYIPNLAPTYIPVLPTDPLGGQGRCGVGTVRQYLYRSDGANYKLLSHCAPEATTLSATDTFQDPIRPTNTWQVSSPGGSSW